MFSTRLPPEETAFFLDYDGTLSEIVTEPDRAAIRPDALAALRLLHQAAGGALAVVSGRSIEQLDRMLFPLRLPLAGVHGAELRDGSGHIKRAAYDAEAELRLITRIRNFAAPHAGLLMEAKPGAVALHYRQRPELESECLAFASVLVAADPRIQLLRGKMVAEFKLSRRDKGDAIADFMREPPFLGKRPFFAGDDATDEAGFSIVNRMGGISLKIGPGISCASHRVDSIAAFIPWLRRAAFAAAPVHAGGEGT